MSKIVGLFLGLALALPAAAQSTSACFDLYQRAGQRHALGTGVAGSSMFFLGVPAFWGVPTLVGPSRLAMGFGAGVALAAMTDQSRRTLFEHIVAGTIAEARGSAAGAYTARAARVINVTLSETAPRWQGYRIPGAERASLRASLKGAPVSSPDVLRATRVLDGNNGLCGIDVGVLKPSDWVRAIVSVVAASR